ncbi:hypothetical protein RCO28_34240 [Streptomyces sp. LHD-70]|uniref:hypothetical protein n=1 Tax=Streptomyces sp. LHD-70 TaxID=3072140 RepID=UPI00280FAF6F|nr:hypothetical protein [Streptomyces sp. LHD-70]MDQ8707493.1 hypothetical protein [Streptomyces sp. LHD-70]
MTPNTPQRAAGWHRWALGRGLIGGPRRSLRAGIGLLLLAGVLSLLAAGVAAAAPEPTPRPEPSQTIPDRLPSEPNPLEPTPAPGPTQEPGPAQKAIDKAKKKKLLSDWDRRIETYKKDRRNGGVLSAFEVTDRDGNPVSSYRIFDDTGSWKDWDLKVAAFLVDGFFLGTKWCVSFASFLLAWSLSFKLAGLLLKPALAVSDSLYGSVMVQMGLPGLFLTFATMVASWHLLFGNRARGWGEALAAMVISALALGALAAPPQMLLSEEHGAVGSVRAFAVEVAALVLDNEDAITTPKTTVNGDVDDTVPAGSSAGEQVRGSAAALARPITDELVDAFVVRPSMLLSYGQTFDGACAKKFRDSRIQQAVFDQSIDNAIAKGKSLRDIPVLGVVISGGLNEPIQDLTMEMVQEQAADLGPMAKFEKECVKGEAGSLKKASMDKVGGAAFMFFAALLACVFIVVLDGAFLYAQVCLAKEAMLAKVALVVGVLPGPGRAWLWARGLAVLRYLGLMVLAVVSLAVLIVVLTAILNAPEKDLPGGVTVRFIVIDILCICAFIFRKRLARSTQHLAARARGRLGSSVFGGASSPTDLGSSGSGRRGSMGRRLLIGGLMLGALAASGGTAGAASLGAGGLGSGRGSTYLARRLVRGGGRLISSGARATGSAVTGAAKGSVALGKLGLRSTLGLPVYGPRAARRTSAALTAMPGRTASGAAGLGQRLQTIHQQYAPAVQDFTGEYVHNVRSLGRFVTGRGRSGPYVPRPRTAPPTTPVARAVVRPPASSSPRPRPTAPAPAPARVVVRRRPVPPHQQQPPATAAQAGLHRRLHRIRNAPQPTGGGRPARRLPGGRP